MRALIYKNSSPYIIFWTAIFLGLVSFLSISTSAHAQNTYPNKPLKLIAPFPPGGTSDILGRILAQKLSDSLGQSMIVENKGGASGNIGHEYVMKANPDGYTLILSSSGVVVNNPHLFKQLNFNWYVDFVPISMVATAGQVLVVHPSVPVKSVAELTAMAKAKPGSINFGSGGKGISSHITGELYKAAAGIDIVHIPYKGSGQAVADVAAGQIQMVFSDMAPAVALIKGGKLRPLAVTSTQRSNIMPEIPTMIEAGYPNFESVVWWSLAAPKGTPQAVIQRLNADLSKIMVSAEIKEAFDKLGITPLFSTPARVHEIAKRDSPIIGELLRKSGVEKE